MSKQRKSYSKEFKEEAVKLAKSEGVTKASKELGVHQASLNRWMKMLNLAEWRGLAGNCQGIYVLKNPCQKPTFKAQHSPQRVVKIS